MLVIYLHHYDTCLGRCSSYYDWKDATGSFEIHLKSMTHAEAVEDVITLLRTTSYASELFSKGNK